MSTASVVPSVRPARAPFVVLVIGLLVGLVVLPPAPARGDSGPDHLVISEVVTGGGSASDEFIELYNPTAAALPLEGLELIYVSASGLTVSRRAAWELGAPLIDAGHHLLVANEAGAYAPIADATYASGMAATGGSVALRIVGAATAVDAVGWGTAASTWLEGDAVDAPPAGSSIERLPGGASGSTRDTDDNRGDFVVRAMPEPQNTGSAPTPDPSATPMPSATAGHSDAPSPSPAPSASLPTPVASPPGTPAPSPSASDAGTPPPSAPPGPPLTTVAVARTLPDGSSATVEVTAISGSGFTDGGGHVTDATGGIAVLATGVAFERGERLRLTGTVDDRYSQRTFRVAADGLVRLGSGPEPAPSTAATGSIGEASEGRLVRISGIIVGSRTTLTSGVAHDVDDGSGPVRVLVGTATGIDTGPWEPGRSVSVVGVAGQRDSTGSGTSGYRVLPRDAADVTLGQPTASPTAPPSASPSPGGGTGPIAIAAARQVPKNGAVRIRGVVTMPTRIVDPVTVVVQDASGGIVLRLGEEVGSLARGSQVEISGVRSTMAGMETVRVTTAPHAVTSGTEPSAATITTGAAGETYEARLVVARGALVTAARRYSSGTVSFEIDDGSGPLRVSIATATGIDAADLAAGTWIEVRGVLGQETSGAQPLRGYRIWPRDVADLRVVAPATGPGAGSSGTDGDGSGAASGAAPTATLADVDAGGSGGMLVGATLVAGPWPELDLGGVLWDGVRLVGLHSGSADAVRALLGERRPPLAVQLDGLRLTGTHADLGIPIARLSADPGSLLAMTSIADPPRATVPRGSAPAWTSLVGRVVHEGPGPTLVVDGGRVRVAWRCAAEVAWGPGQVGVVGIGLGGPSRVFVPCGGVHPAPTLMRGAVPAPGDADPTRVIGDPSAPSDTAGMPGRAPAAGVVGLAAVILGGAAAVARRLDRDEADPPPDPEDGTAADEGMPRSVAPPSLTLVPVPREGAP